MHQQIFSGLLAVVHCVLQPTDIDASHQSLENGRLQQRGTKELEAHACRPFAARGFFAPKSSPGQSGFPRRPCTSDRKVPFVAPSLANRTSVGFSTRCISVDLPYVIEYGPPRRLGRNQVPDKTSRSFHKRDLVGQAALKQYTNGIRTLRCRPKPWAPSRNVHQIFSANEVQGESCQADVIGGLSSARE